ncbi:PREDICTED: jerky protein homolog-like [Cyphomyrmex costatus]|uniref:jerky protein homolog-like n=1 Tax=Cyphomyrmex costatus TaxID=456900 RepID=UPI00085241D1|nr:PREDICTED: jerky protein homolog-like [Cyphomyrmex costatus]
MRTSVKLHCAALGVLRLVFSALNCVNMNQKRKCVTISNKQQIIEEIASGLRVKDVARKYGITSSSVSKIMKQKDHIASFSKSMHHAQLKKVSKMRCPTNVDAVLYTWFCQQRSWGQTISGPLLCEKAQEINKILNGPASFMASNGWLQKFKQRHGICQSSIQEKLSYNTEEIKHFPEKFHSFVKDHGYTLQNIYNADETGLYWRTLPQLILTAEHELSAANLKVSKERLTAMMCANANGTHKLPLLIIGKYKNPRCMKNVCKLPVIFTTQKNAWMDRTIFFDWYTNVFIKLVLEKQTEQGRNEKVLLILDNAPSHPSEDQLNSVNENFKVVFLSPNVTAILQPMDQGIIEQTKRNYRKNVLRLLLEANLLQTVFLKKLTILDCCNMIAEAWNNVLFNDLRRAWKNLLSINDAVDVTLNDNSNGRDESENCFNEISSVYTQNEIQSWINIDSRDQGWEPQNMNDIIDNLQNNNEHESAEEEESHDENDSKSVKLSKDIIQAVHIFKNWSQHQQECTMSDFISITKVLNVAEKLLGQ